MTYRGYHTLAWLPSDQYAQNQSGATDRGRPNAAIKPLSNAVIALTRSPATVTTIRPNALVSHSSQARTSRSRTFFSFGEFGSGGGSPFGSWRASVARARLTAP